MNVELNTCTYSLVSFSELAHLFLPSWIRHMSILDITHQLQYLLSQFTCSLLLLNRHLKHFVVITELTKLANIYYLPCTEGFNETLFQNCLHHYLEFKWPHCHLEIS